MKKIEILLVEDEAIIALEIERNLHSLGYEVTSIVDNGTKAIEKAEEDRPDLILMDIRIKGGMDGIEAAEIIGSRFGIPVIFSTAHVDEKRIDRAKITMPFGYLLKPLRARDLKVAIEMAMYISKVNTERKLAIAELEESEQRVRLERDKFQSVLNAIGEGVYIADDNYFIEYHNEILDKQYGDSVGKKCYETFFNSKKPCRFCPLHNKTKRGVIQNIEAFLPDGRNVNIVFSPYSDIDGSIKTVILLFDITEKKSFQAETMRAGHLASLGELSAGIAHEINNPINGIISLAELLKDRLLDLNQETEIPDQIIKEGDRIAVIVSNLLSFARDKKEEHSPALLADILDDSINLIEKQLIKDNITLQIEIPPNLPKIKVRSQEIQQVFLNLLSNARYALNQKYTENSDQKKIIFKADSKQTDEGSFVQIVFQDSGEGIPSGQLDKITNPFYSTKPQGEGTGLGLSISHSIIKSHEGRIRFESKEGDYTRVIIELPVINS